MPSFMQAVERLRERGLAPASGRVCLRDLSNRAQPTPRGCVRPLIARALDTAERKPWAVLLCRYKGQAANTALEAPIEAFYRRAFAPGTGGLVEYWRDVSLGAIDISGSVVWGWLELEIPIEDGDVGSGVTRGGTVDYAIKAARRAGLDPETGFHSQIAVIAHNWSTSNVPAGHPNWQPNDPLKPYYPYWIDGSADGRGKVTLTPPHNGNITAHEMGHGFGMHHDVGADMVTHYADPCCIMSQHHAFVPPGWSEDFGPALCLPHLIQKGWMFSRRLFSADEAWMRDGISLPLAPLTAPGMRANLGVKLPFRAADGRTWDYYLEYVTPRGWTTGIGEPFVFVRRMAPVVDGRDVPIILGSIKVPSQAGVTVPFVEPSGNVRFEVGWAGQHPLVLKVSARRQ